MATTRAKLILARHLSTQITQDGLGIDLMTMRIKSIVKLTGWDDQSGH